jgi:hypothetical protein
MEVNKICSRLSNLVSSQSGHPKIKFVSKIDLGGEKVRIENKQLILLCHDSVRKLILKQISFLFRCNDFAGKKKKKQNKNSAVKSPA